MNLDKIQFAAFAVLVISGALFCIMQFTLPKFANPIPKDGWCHYDSPVVAVGCTDGHCLVCNADQSCRWMDWYTTCGDREVRSH